MSSAPPAGSRPQEVFLLADPLAPGLGAVCALIAAGEWQVKAIFLADATADALQATAEALARSLAFARIGCEGAEHRHRSADPAPSARMPIPQHLPKDGLPTEAEAQIVIVPEQMQLEGDTLDVVISPTLSRTLELLEQRGLGLWEEGLRRLADTLPTAGPLLSLNESYERLHHQALFWADLPASELANAWEGSPGRMFRALQAMELWRYRLLQRHPAQIGAWIKRLQADEQDWGVRLALLLYKRVEEGLTSASLPAWLKSGLEPVLSSWGRPLTLLAPLADETISILLPTYNRAELLAKAVASVRGQSYQDWILLIADDGSSDGTEALGPELEASDPRIRYFRKPQNSGFADTMQFLFQQATTELVVNYTDDQFMLPHFLADCMAFWREHPWIATVGGGLRIVLKDQGNQAIIHGPFYPQPQIADTQKELQRLGHICSLGPTCVYRKRLLKQVATRDPWFGTHQEAYSPWDYLSIVYLMGRYEIGYLPEVVMEMFQFDESMSSGRDNNFELLSLLELLLEDYQALFGAGAYPREVADFFIYCRQLDIQQRFAQLLSISPPEAFEAQHLRQARGWKLLVTLRDRLERQCRAGAEILFDRQNPYR